MAVNQTIVVLERFCCDGYEAAKYGEHEQRWKTANLAQNVSKFMSPRGVTAVRQWSVILDYFF